MRPGSGGDASALSQRLRARRAPSRRLVWPNRSAGFGPNRSRTNEPYCSRTGLAGFAYCALAEPAGRRQVSEEVRFVGEHVHEHVRDRSRTGRALMLLHLFAHALRGKPEPTGDPLLVASTRIVLIIVASSPTP